MDAEAGQSRLWRRSPWQRVWPLAAAGFLTWGLVVAVAFGLRLVDGGAETASEGEGLATLHSAIFAVSCGALAGLWVQGTAGVLALHRQQESSARFLGAFALVAAVRVFGGVLVVLLGLVPGGLDPLPFLAGFGAEYIVLEVVTNVMFVRSEHKADLS